MGDILGLGLVFEDLLCIAAAPVFEGLHGIVVCLQKRQRWLGSFPTRAWKGGHFKSGVFELVPVTGGLGHVTPVCKGVT